MMDNANNEAMAAESPDLESPEQEHGDTAEDEMLKAHPMKTPEALSKGRNVDALFNVKLDVRVVLGHKKMPVAELLKLSRGSVIELDRKVGDPVDIMINDRLVARGDLIKIEGEMIGVALREIIKDFAPGD